MNKLKTMLMAGAALFGAAQTWGATVDVSTWAKLKENLEAGNSVKLMANITQDSTYVTLSGSQVVTLDLNGKKITSTNTGRVFDLTSAVKLTITDSAGGGVIDGQNVSRTTVSGGCIKTANGAEFVFESGTIQNFKTTVYNGGAVCNEGTFMMKDGTITNCASAGNGGAVCNTGTFTMSNGVITACKSLGTASGTVGGGGVYISGGTFKMKGGLIAGCSATEGSGAHSGGGICNHGGTTYLYGCVSNCSARSGAGVAFRAGSGYIYSGSEIVKCRGVVVDSNTADAPGMLVGDATVTMYGGRICDNSTTGTRYSGVAVWGQNYTFTMCGGVISGNTTSISGNCQLGTYKGTLDLKGGVLEQEPSAANVNYNGSYTVPAYTKVGSNWVVGQSIAYDENNKLTAGTYTFCPTNAEYVAAGVAVADDRVVNEAATTPTTWLVQRSETVSTFAELKAAISDAYVNVINLAADIDIPCQQSAAYMTTTAALMVNRNLTIQGKNGIAYRLRRTGDSTSNFNRSVLEVYGNGTYDGITVTLKDVTFDGGAVWPADSTPKTRWENKGSNYDTAYYGKSTLNSGVSGHGVIDIANKATVNIESGVTIQNADCSCNARTRGTLTESSGANCYGAGVRIECYYEIGGGTVNLKMGAVVKDCTASGFGGGLGAYNLARLNIYGGTLLRCSSSNGGAIGVTRASGAYGKATSISAVNAGVISLSNATFADCWAQNGGAMRVDGTATSATTDTYYQYSRITGATITNCTASVSGAAMFLGYGNVTHIYLARKAALNVVDSSGDGNYTGLGYTTADGIFREQGTEIISEIEAELKTVTFMNAGAVYGVVSVEKGRSCGAMFPEDPQSAGAIFLGWFNGDVQYTAETVIQEDTVLTAKWGGVTVAIPSVEHATYTNVTVNGETVQVKDGVVLVKEGVTIVVHYQANTGYILTGAKSATLTNVSEERKEIDTSAVTVAPLIQVGDDAWAWVTNGLCEVTGTTATWSCDKAGESPLYAYRNSITNVIVCDGVTGIGARFFENFWNLADVTLAASVTDVGARAFKKCYGLTNVVSLATGDSTVGNNAFTGCFGLQQLTFAGSPDFGAEAYTMQTAIVMHNGYPEVYAIPQVTVSGKTQHVMATNNLSAKESEWVDVTDMTAEERSAYHFFKIVLK